MNSFSALQVYMILTLLFFALTNGRALREMRAREDFESTRFGGITNVYRYYRHLKKNNEKLSSGFKLFLLAYANFAACIIIFVIREVVGK